MMSVLLELICVSIPTMTHWVPTLAAVNQVTLWMQMDTLAMVCRELSPTPLQQSI